MKKLVGGGRGTARSTSIWQVGDCGKICYDETRADLMLRVAQSQAWKLQRRREKRKYYCERCRAWHLTSQDPRSTATTGRQP